jgi:hypothetical protein
MEVKFMDDELKIICNETVVDCFKSTVTGFA